MAYARNNDQNDRREQEKALALVEVQPPRLPYPVEAKAEGMSEGQWKALVDAVFPSAKSVDGVLLAIRYAKARGLDIFKRVVHVVPMWNSKLGREVETVWPGIGELRTTASRTGAHAGNDDCVFGPTKSKLFKDRKTRKGRGQNAQEYVDEAEAKLDAYPEWAQITVYKIVQGQRVAFVGPKVRFDETFSGMKGLQVPNDRWQRAPFQMLEKCAEAAALRRAFPDELGDSWSAEEMEGRDLSADGSIEADYVVTAEEDRPKTAEAPTRAASVDQRDPDQEKYDWWGPGALNDFMEFSRDGFATVKSIKAIDKYLADEKESIANLPSRARTDFDAMVEAARERVRAAKAKPAGKEPKPEDEQEDRTGSATYTAEDYERYLATLERMAGEAKTPVDVNSLRSREKETIGQLPDEYQTRANNMLDAAMAKAKNEGNENV